MERWRKRIYRGKEKEMELEKVEENGEKEGKKEM
jgi:hypothetical protein